MNLEAKKKITAAIDSLAKQGKVATSVAMHPDTAKKNAISGTHLDWKLHPEADQVAAELMDPKYDERPDTDPHQHNRTTGEKKLYRPKSAEEAAKVAKARCEKDLRRDVFMAVKLDETVPLDKFRVSGVDRQEHTEEV